MWIASDEPALKEPVVVEATETMLSSGEPNRYQPITSPPISLDELSFYEFFLQRMVRLTSEAPLGVDDLLQHLDISKAQLNLWLKRAVADKRLKKIE